MADDASQSLCYFTPFPLCSSQVLIDEADKADADFLGILLEVIEVGREAANSEMQRAFVSEFSIKHPLLFYKKISHYYTTHGSLHLESYAPIWLQSNHLNNKYTNIYALIRK